MVSEDVIRTIEQWDSCGGDKSVNGCEVEREKGKRWPRRASRQS
jgi:hypothetical protein